MEEAPHTFVFVFLRGGCDGLHFVAPVSDRHYTAQRSTDIRITDSGDAKGLLLKNPLNNLDFALHPKAAALKELYDGGHLALIHAAGLIHGTRSHFEAQELIERGTDKQQSLSGGWLTRYLQSQPQSRSGILPAVSLGSAQPLSLLGAPSATIEDLNDYALKGDKKISGIVKKLYRSTAPLDYVVQQTLKDAAALNTKLAVTPPNQPDSRYPKNDAFAARLQTLSRLIKSGVGVHLATVDVDGWDTHEAQAYHFPVRLQSLSASLSAFYNDLSAVSGKLTVLVMSEFGRRLKGNRSGGTDHGYGGVMLVLGGGIRGGTMYGQWNGLATEQLDNGVDLAVTTDYRTVASEILNKRLGCTNLTTIFPQFTAKSMLGFA